jgi:hypothetical protein
LERQPGPSDRSRAHTSDWRQLKFASVTCGTAVIVFCIIGVIGIDMLRKVDLREHGAAKSRRGL